MSLTGLTARPLRVLQISDLHLCPEPGDVMGSGVDTDESLAQVLSRAQQREHPLDLMMVTGDLVHTPEGDAYRRLRRTFNRLPWPVHCLPGNHDEPDLMEDTLAGDNIDCRKVLIRGDWLILLLDSVVPGESAGYLDDHELALLEETLSRHPARNALICLHHPVIPLGSAWMDRIGLANTDDLFRVIDAHPKVRAVLFGHAHREVDETRNGVRLLGAPSTGVQFAPHTPEPRLDDLPPGYRHLELHADGRVQTRVEYLPQATALRRRAS
ncbi:phosphodiesterase [Ectothiorhodospira mobilis]|uniref:Icc protein n=1 Tax=Ectothiorhodospira mobilis TaxID=195064 RepID=A0A1I4S6B4_ECTMO|nr:phosphodiesterase [Ectothiorhodospira mobilis]MCG5534607.1 phosphodiesterase [Ectothiorhodospira mobilis]SFM59810.1 Icc protein [Ectothiorhodospira mobilis]